MKGMTPEEWDRKAAEMKRKIEDALRNRPNYCEHLHEQYEAFLRESADMIVKDHVDMTPIWAVLQSRLNKHARRERIKARLLKAVRWISLTLTLAAILYTFVVFVFWLCKVLWRLGQ